MKRKQKDSKTQKNSEGEAPREGLESMSDYGGGWEAGQTKVSLTDVHIPVSYFI